MHRSVSADDAPFYLIGQAINFMDVEDIHAIIVDQLAGLGIGRKYVEGLVQAAHQEFITENNQSWQNRLIGVGHSHALKEDMRVLVDSIFTNTAALQNATSRPTAARPWWRFYSGPRLERSPSSGQ